MPRKCCVPGCRSNYTGSGSGYVNVFSFPKNDSRRSTWLQQINRKDIRKGAVVCIKHFDDKFIIREHRATRPDGSELVMPRRFPTLANDAYPSIFNEQTPPKRKGPKKRLLVQEKKAEEEFKEYLYNNNIESFDSFNQGVATRLSLRSMTINLEGKPSSWSDVDNIDWAPTVKMGCDLKSSQRKKPHKNTAQKRAMRVQELQKKKMMLGLATDAKLAKMPEQKGEPPVDVSPKQAKGASSSGGSKQGKVKKNAAKGKAVKAQRLKGKSGLLDSSKKGAPRKKVKASKKPEPDPEPTYSFQIRRMLKKQEIKVRRKILELELSGSKQSYNAPKEEKVTVNPIIHRITLDSISIEPEDGEDNVKVKQEPMSADYETTDIIIVPDIKEEVMDTESEAAVKEEDPN